MIFAAGAVLAPAGFGLEPVVDWFWPKAVTRKLAKLAITAKEISSFFTAIALLC